MGAAGTKLGGDVGQFGDVNGKVGRREGAKQR